MAFDQSSYVREVINPLRDHPGGLPATDLARHYAITPGMPAEEIRAQLKQVRNLWQRKLGGAGAAAAVCAQLISRDERLQAEHGNAMADPKWWRGQEQQRDRAVQAESQRFAEVLRNAYGAVGRVTAEQLAAIAQQWPELSRGGVDEAVRLAGLRLVEIVELPSSSGLGSSYRRLVELQKQLGVRTVVQLVRPELVGGSFTLLGADAVTLDADTVDEQRRAMEQVADANEVRARKEALGLLDTALRHGVDLRTVALFQIVERLQDLRARNLADAFLVESATDAGLALAEAQAVVSNLSAAVVAGPAERIRDLLTDGQLLAADQALPQLPAADPDRPELQQAIETRLEQVRKLRQSAETAIRERREEDAATDLRDALRIAADDEELRRRAETLPPPPARDPVARATDQGVRLSWSPPRTAVPELLRYRVVRSGQPPRTAADGEVIADDLTTTEAVDLGAPPARELHYGVFASTGGDWSRPATAVERLLPAVSAVQVRIQPNEIACSWRVHPAAESVRVRRTLGRAPASPDDGVEVNATRAGLYDDTAGDDADRFYGIVAVYRDDTGAEAGAPMVVARATLGQAAPPFVERMRVHATAVDAQTATVHLTWPAPATGTVSVRRAGLRPTWPAGTTISRAEAEGYGEPLIGDRLVQGPESQLEAVVPSGQFFYTAFTLHPTAGTAIVGEPVSVGVTEPVGQLRVRRIGSEATVAWVWPPSVSLAEVAFTPSGAGRPSVRERVSRGQLTANGCRIPVGSSGGRITVQGVVRGSGGEAMSAAAVATVDGVAGTLDYELLRVGGLFSRKRLLRVTVDQPCAGVELILVAAPGLVLPIRPEQGRAAVHVTGLALTPELPWEAPFTLPSGPPKPRWLRCFVKQPAGVRVTDPPIDEMKVS